MESSADILSHYSVPRHRLTVADYHRLGEAGILRGDDRVELLQGQLVDMSPIGPRHALAVDALARVLIKAADEHVEVRVQNPVQLDAATEPQPDVVVVRRPWIGYPTEHPGAPDVLLLIEVSDSSLDSDRGAKRALYAAAGIPEFWLVDLTSDTVLVHRLPRGQEYASVSRVDASGVLQVTAIPGLAVPASKLFA